MKFTLKELKNNVNISKISPLKELFTLLGSILAIVLIIYIALGFAVDIVVQKLPLKMEQEIGRFYLMHYALEAPKTPAEKRLQKLLHRLQSNLPSQEIDFQAHIIDVPEANALALPGGHIVVTTGLISSVESENELAMILAHELGHFANKDHLRGLGRGLVLTTLSTIVLGKDNPATHFLQNILLKAEMKFSQHQERLGDVYGLHLLAKTYGHCAGATDFFKRIKQKEKKSSLAHFFSTHPSPEDRVSYLEKLIKENNYAVRGKIPLDPAFKGCTLLD